MSKKSNFSIGPIIILILIIVHLVRQGHINDWLNKKVNMKRRSEAIHLCMKETNDAFKCKNPLRNSILMEKRFKDMIEKLKKEDKIKLFKLKDMNYEPIKPVNPHTI